MSWPTSPLIAGTPAAPPAPGAIRAVTSPLVSENPMSWLVALLIATTPDAGVAAVPGHAPAAATATTTREPAGTARSALCAELKKSGRELAASRAKLDEDTKALEAERAKLEAERATLEAVATEIAKSREALREETARLEALLKRAPGGPGSPSAATTPTGTSSAPGAHTGAEPSASAAAMDAKSKQDLDGLAMAVKAMRPEQAATVVARIDRDLGARLLSRMRPADAGAVMQRLEAEVAADLLQQMAALPKSKKVVKR